MNLVLKHELSNEKMPFYAFLKQGVTFTVTPYMGTISGAGEGVLSVRLKSGDGEHRYPHPNNSYYYFGVFYPPTRDI